MGSRPVRTVSLAAVVHRVDRVQHQRHQHLGQLLGVSDGGGQAQVQLASHGQALEALVVLQQKEGLIHQRVQHHSALGLSLRPAEVEQSVDDPGAAVHFLVDQLQVLLDRGPLGPRCVVQPPGDGRDAGADGGQRVVDLVHDAGGQLADGGQLLALHDLTLNSARVGHVLADGDDVTDLVALQPHRNLGQPEGAHLAAQGHVQLGLLDLSGLKDAVELRPELLGRLPGEHLEDLSAHHLVATQPRCPDLALAVPDLDPVLPVHDVEPEGQAVDDEPGEPPLLVDLAGLGGDFDGEVGREGERREVGCEQIGDDGEDLELGRLGTGPHLQQAYLGLVVLQREADADAVGWDAVERVEQLRLTVRGGAAMTRKQPVASSRNQMVTASAGSRTRSTSATPPKTSSTSRPPFSSLAIDANRPRPGVAVSARPREERTRRRHSECASHRRSGEASRARTSRVQSKWILMGFAAG